MGIETLILASAGLQLLGGFQAQQAAEEQAEASEAETLEKASLRKREIQKQLARNTALFAKSGVSLEGSPLFSLEQGAATGAEDIQAIGRTGAAEASSLRAKGRAAFLGSVAGAASTGAK